MGFLFKIKNIGTTVGRCVEVKNMVKNIYLKVLKFFVLSYIIIYDNTKKGAYLMNTHEQTMTFSVQDEKENEMKRILTVVYDALKEKGYNPVNQIVGYILSEDPTYITTFNNARSMVRRVDRDELLQALVKSYLTA